jgi:hypothetical protein
VSATSREISGGLVLLLPTLDLVSHTQLSLQDLVGYVISTARTHLPFVVVVLMAVHWEFLEPVVFEGELRGWPLLTDLLLARQIVLMRWMCLQQVGHP